MVSAACVGLCGKNTLEWVYMVVVTLASEFGGYFVTKVDQGQETGILSASV